VPETLEQGSDIMSDFEDHPKVACGTILEASKFSGCNILRLDNFLPEVKGSVVQTFLQLGSINGCNGETVE
jgi:hypothetical protein